MKNGLSINCTFDADSAMWYVAHSDIPGLATEAPSMDILEWRIRQVVPELLLDNASSLTGDDLHKITICFERPLVLAAE
jgi:Domain of unknown function (DUF1902)